MSKGAVRRLIIEGSEIEYELIRKRIRNIYFSVKGGGKVLVSAPASVPICYVEKSFDEQVAKYSQSVGFAE